MIRNSSNELVTNHEIGIRISILKSVDSDSSVYSETHTANTNFNGLVTIAVGSGNILNGLFENINWANGPYFIKTEIDITGGTFYTITGTSQLLSVPYALYAKVAKNCFSGNYNDLTNKPDLAKWDKDSTDNVTLMGNETIFGNKTFCGSITIPYPVSADNAATKAYVDELLSRIEALEESDILNNGFKDYRDGNHYGAVKIGNQLWMTENLRYLPSVMDPITGSTTDPYYYVYGYEGTNVSDAKATTFYSVYGVLYNWVAAMNGSAPSSSNPSGIQGVCPSGWHLPSAIEWDELGTYLAQNGYNFDSSFGGGGDKIAKSLVSTSSWSSSAVPGAPGNTDYSEYFNKSGFSALPAGKRSYFSPYFSFEGLYGFWWSTTYCFDLRMCCRFISYDACSLKSDYTYRLVGFSVRCLKD